ncbi:hypothetical protein J4232_03490 [Candidatus Woesearchaeota archaeon]|nr:hypothetical protein [Candidatus Woesearchaeota archaeon]
MSKKKRYLSKSKLAQHGKKQEIKTAVAMPKDDSQKLKQFEQQIKQQSSQTNQLAKQRPQHHKRNILLIIIVVLLFIAILFVINLNANQREKAALQLQEKQSDYVPYEDIVEPEQAVPIAPEEQFEQLQKAEQQAVSDVPKEIIAPTVISEEQLIKQQSSQGSGQQLPSLESQLSLEYTDYFLGGCKDSDGGKNFYEQGTTVSKTGSAELDLCSTAKQYPNRLYEFYCDKNEMARKMVFECPNGCKDGVCAAEK